MIDTDQLPPGEKQELHRLVDEANFFELPEHAEALPSGAADYRQYTISVEDGARTHTASVADTVGSPQVQALVANLQAKTRARLDSPGA
jgi:hypothetical protein